MIRILHLFEKIFSAVSILFFSQAFFSFFFNTSAARTPDQDSPLLRLIFLGIYAVSFALLAFRWQTTLQTIARNKWIFLLLTLAVFSTLWSSVPAITFRKSIALIGSTLFGVYLGSRYKFDELLKIMSFVYAIAIPLSFAFALLLPQIGVMQIGAWRGIYLHKNGLGENMFISFMTFYFLSKTPGRFWPFYHVGYVASFVLILFAKSATSLLSTIFVFVAANSLRHLSLKTKGSVFKLIVFLTLLFFSMLTLMININEFLATSNRDITLTGRTPIWTSLVEFVQQRFWFGYGYGAFFTASHPETEIFWQTHKWKPPHAHNGYFQMMLDLGFTGVSIFIWNYLHTINKALFNYLLLKDIRILWILLYLVYTIIFNITEVSFLSYNLLNWVIAVAFICSLNSIIAFEK